MALTRSRLPEPAAPWCHSTNVTLVVNGRCESRLYYFRFTDQPQREPWQNRELHGDDRRGKWIHRHGKPSVSGLGSRVTASFNPASVTGSGTSILSVQPAGNASKGARTITITGIGNTVSHSTSATLNVQ